MGIAKPATDVDHITPLADNGEPFDFGNLRSLCHECHSRVTGAWRNGRTEVVVGVNAETGVPIVIDRTRGQL